MRRGVQGGSLWAVAWNRLFAKLSGCSAVPSFPARADIALLPHHPPASLGIIIFIANVRVLAEARFGADSQEPLVEQ